MIQQFRLDGSAPNEDTIIQDYCCSSCYNAKQDVCVCRCRGAYHGLGVKRNDPKDKTLPPKEEKRFKRLMTIRGCRWCNADLEHEPIYYYPHTGGWEVPNIGKVWLYIHCPKCAHEWSLYHLGVNRNA